MLAVLLASVAAAGAPAVKPAPAPVAGCQTRSCVKRVRVRNAKRLRAKRQRVWIKKEIRKVTPYSCSFGRAATPCYIVACESHGSWSAYNSSGAAGRYQIMPEWGRPWPIRSEADKLAHHRIAHRIYNGGAGASNWVCA